MKNPIIMHINYAEISGGNFGKRSVDDVCRAAAQFGFDGIEFRGAIPKSLGDVSFREYAEQIAAGKKKYGLSEMLLSFGMADCASPEREKREKCLTDTVEKAKIAREICGANVCNTSAAPTFSTVHGVTYADYKFNGSAAATEENWKLTVDTYQRLGAELEKLDLRFAFETHMNYIHDLPAPSKKLVDMIDSPYIGINMDYGNTVYFPARPTLEETIDLYGDKLFYLHMKNSVAVPGGNGLRLPTALSDGEINHRLYVEKLQEVGFAGPIGIEAPRPGDRYHYAKTDLAYIRSVIEDLR
ncbi:MAG: sugar phosphate isomerase/epimerase [Clostridia bacterium]|nr:sugar phosphate isomerase/epimerase [Clostridia bacterium]